MKTCALVTHQGVQDYLGVRFRPGGALSFLKSPVSELTDRSVPLETFWGSAAQELEERLLLATTRAERICLLESALLRYLASSTGVEPAVQHGLGLIVRSKGLIKQEEWAKRLGYSTRHLRRKIQQCVGVSPKTFSRIVRFLHVMEAAERANDCSWTKLANEAGYSDQAHFIRDFKALAGISPSRLSKLNGKKPDECPIFTIQSLRALVAFR